MLIDAGLVDRLESTSATLSRLVAASMASTGTPAAAEPWCGGWLVSLGPGRYINRAVGIAGADVGSEDLDAMEAFFDERGVTPMVETSTWASDSLIAGLGARRYTPAWFRNVHVLDLSGRPSAPVGSDVQIEPVDGDDVQAWRDLLANGNEITGTGRKISDEHATARHAMAEGRDFIARIDGRPVGCASLESVDGVAWLGGAATLPAARGRGVQAALLRHRLELASADGSELAAATALPRGQSARNLQRAGLAVAYAQVELVRPAG
jgi:GNAT superfamily N-acetyltransferase